MSTPTTSDPNLGLSNPPAPNHGPLSGSSIPPPQIAPANSAAALPAWWSSLPANIQQQLISQWDAQNKGVQGLATSPDQGGDLKTWLSQPGMQQWVTGNAPVTFGGQTLGQLGGVSFTAPQTTVERNAYDSAITQVPASSQYMQMIIQAGQQYNVPWQVLYAVINQESGFQNIAEESGGMGRGVAQIDLGQHPEVSESQANNPAFAINWMAQYLSQQDQKLGDWGLAIEAYNIGPNAALAIKNGTATQEQTELGKTYLTSVFTKTNTANLGWDASTAVNNATDALTGAQQRSSFLGLPDQASLSASASDLLKQILLINPSQSQTQSLVNLVNNYVGSVNQARQTQDQATSINPYGGAGIPTGAQGLTGQGLVQAAMQYAGTKYVWGGKNPSTGLDCSGLVTAAAQSLGVQLTGSTYDMVKQGTPVANIQDAQPGDLIFFNDNDHVAIYAGNGQMVSADHTGTVVQEEAVWGGSNSISAIRRVVGAGPGTWKDAKGGTTPSSGSAGASDAPPAADTGTAGAGTSSQTVDPSMLASQIGVVSQQHQLDAVHQTERYQALYAHKPAAMGDDLQSDQDFEKQFMDPVTQMVGVATDQQDLDNAVGQSMMSGNPQTGVGYEMGLPANMNDVTFRERMFKAAQDVGQALSAGH